MNISHQGNVSENHKNILANACNDGYCLSQMERETQQTLTSVTEDVGKQKPLYIVAWNVEQRTHYEN